MVAARPQPDVIVAASELLMLRDICKNSVPTATPAGIIDFLHMDALIQQKLIQSAVGGYLCTSLGHKVAVMKPSEVYGHAFIFRSSDIALN